MLRACKKVIEECNDGLDLARLTSLYRPEDYVLYRCYFYTLRGRAHALLGRYSEAYRNLDCSGAGIEPAIGSNRIALAVRKLALAEALMLHADDQITEAVADRNGQHDRKGLSIQGWLFLASRNKRKELKERCTDLRPSRVKELCRKALTLYYFGKVPGRHAETAIHCYHLVRGDIEQIASREEDSERDDAAKALKILKDWENDAEESKLLEDFAQFNDGSDDSQKQIVQVYQRSLAFWSPERLQDVTVRPTTEPQARQADSAALHQANPRDGKAKPSPLDRFPDELALVIRRARSKLERAGEALEQAERILVNGRRDIHWWHKLHELTAQVHFERLLLMITHGPEEPDVLENRQFFYVKFMTGIRNGLRAVRDGLDCVPSSEEDDGLPEPREFRLHGLYIELMIASFCHGFLRLHDVGGMENEDVVARLWARWKWINESTGLHPLLDRADKDRFLTYLASVRLRLIYYLNKTPGLNYSFITRSLVERFINECLHYGGTTWLRRLPGPGECLEKRH
jgi:hypothetical protein